MSEQAPNEARNEGGSVTEALPESPRQRREAKALAIVKSIGPQRAYPNTNPTSPDELVYFVYCAGLIKIGYTAGIATRIANLANQSGAPVTLIAVMPGNKNQEKLMHGMFQADRVHGEWFQLSDEMRRFFACLDESIKALMPPSAGSCLDRLEQAERGLSLI